MKYFTIFFWDFVFACEHRDEDSNAFKGYCMSSYFQRCRVSGVTSRGQLPENSLQKAVCLHFRNLVTLLYCWVFPFAILYASATNNSQNFNDLDLQKKKLYWQSLDQFSFFLMKAVLAAHRQLAATWENCWLCVSPSELSHEARILFFPLFFVFPLNVSCAHNELYRLATLWTSGTHFLCRLVEFITRITTSIDQTNYILDKLLIFRFVVLMWSYQCYCLVFTWSFSTP